MKTNRGLHEGQLKVAESLLEANKRRPCEAHLRRAISSVYYALFHYLAKLCADSFIGSQGAKDRSKHAWQQVYRALEHGVAKNACDAAKTKKFPSEIKHYATLFTEYQRKRHDADYDPYANAAENFNKEDVSNMILTAKNAIQEIKTVPSGDLKAFAAFILLKQRK